MTNTNESRAEAVRAVASSMELLPGVEVVKQKESTGTVSFRLTTDAVAAGKLQRLAPEGWTATPVLTPSDYKNLYIQHDL